MGNEELNLLLEKEKYLHRSLTDLCAMNKGKYYTQWGEIQEKLCKVGGNKYYCSKCERIHFRGKILNDHRIYAKPLPPSLDISIPLFHFADNVSIVGIYYQKNKWGISTSTLFSDIDDDIILKPEPSNEYDNNAVAVWYKKYQLGYLPRGVNKKYFKLLTEGTKIICKFLNYSRSIKHTGRYNSREFQPERAKICLYYFNEGLFNNTINGLNELDSLQIPYKVTNPEIFKTIPPDNIIQKIFPQLYFGWDSTEVFTKLASKKKISWLESHHPLVNKFFPNLDFSDKNEIDTYIKWDINTIVEKLENNEYPNQYDLEHYLFKTNWREIELKIENLGSKNPSIDKFLEYIRNQYSIETDEGFQILL